MIRLSREIRFALVSPEELEAQLADRGQKNSWAAWPNTNRIAPQLRMSAVVEGIPDPVTGYLCNVAIIDEALRSFVNSEIIGSMHSCQTNRLPPAEQVLWLAFLLLRDLKELENAALRQISMEISPFLSYHLNSDDPKMIQLSHQFEFSAAHRLHCDSLSPEENVAMFGKCNNPAGHGHNYVVEVTVGRKLASDAGVVMPIGQLAEIVNRNVIDILDHKNLNEDIDHFSKVNPSVENICLAVFGWLKKDIEDAGCILSEIKVFETPKTWASYCG